MDIIIAHADTVCNPVRTAYGRRMDIVNARAEGIWTPIKKAYGRRMDIVTARADTARTPSGQSNIDSPDVWTRASVRVDDVLIRMNVAVRADGNLFT